MDSRTSRRKLLSGNLDRRCATNAPGRVQINANAARHPHPKTRRNESREESPQYGSAAPRDVATNLAKNRRNALLMHAAAWSDESREESLRPPGGQAETASARPRYLCHTGSIGPADAMSDVVACGATGGRRSTIPHSFGSRASLRALHDRHDATTFSHVCGPPRERGST